ncbi:hypothetical protein X741_32470 [Mesorhizobium sp. LNHC229A00]|nr:hypothetical protein X741_32470 [Mesorhizobium sp. LNHC229A00]
MKTDIQPQFKISRTWRIKSLLVGKFTSSMAMFPLEK